MRTSDSLTLACLFCGGSQAPVLPVDRLRGACCLSCAARLGTAVVEAPGSLLGVWPLLADGEDPLEPEPRVRRPDGTTVELRQVTAELKRELTVEARMKLADTYGELGMLREQILECGQVLLARPEIPLAQRALALLFSDRLCAPGALPALRGRLFPA